MEYGIIIRPKPIVEYDSTEDLERALARNRQKPEPSVDRAPSAEDINRMKAYLESQKERPKVTMEAEQARSNAPDPRPYSRPTEEAIDEAIALIMEESGAATRDSGWQWRELRDYAYNLKLIILEMLDTEEQDKEDPPLVENQD